MRSMVVLPHRDLVWVEGCRLVGLGRVAGARLLDRRSGPIVVGWVGRKAECQRQGLGPIASSWLSLCAVSSLPSQIKNVYTQVGKLAHG